jgi:hypothetical protein
MPDLSFLEAIFEEKQSSVSTYLQDIRRQPKQWEEGQQKGQGVV